MLVREPLHPYLPALVVFLTDHGRLLIAFDVFHTETLHSERVMSGCLWNCDAWRIRDWSSDCPAYRIALGHALRVDCFDEVSMTRDKQVPR